MHKAKQKKKAQVQPEIEEWWGPVRVAAFMGLPYQTARNQMLSEVFGPSRYDPSSRRLTVKGSRVRRARRELKNAKA